MFGVSDNFSAKEKQRSEELLAKYLVDIGEGGGEGGRDMGEE
jgi:hypothetical protein